MLSSSHQKAKAILSTMSQDMVEDIISYVNLRGRGVVADVFSEDGDTDANARFLSIFSRSYIKDKDVPNVLTGFSALVLASIRQPRFSNDDYQRILQDAFSLPSEIAEPLAKQIESYDVMSSVKDTSAWTSISNYVSETARKMANYVAGVLPFSLEIDQNQTYDVDFLYELSTLGEFINKLNTRASLMNAQAAISSNMNVLGTGDIEETGDYEAEVGDALRGLSRRTLPPSVTGGLAPLSRLGHAASATKFSHVMKDAGYTGGNGKPLKPGAPKSPKAKQIIDKLLAMKPGQAVLLGAGLGLTPTVVKGIIKMAKSGAHGDPEQQELYGYISRDLGPNVADAWVNGDIEDVVSQVFSEASDDFSTGDPDLDEQLTQIALGASVGDIESHGPEVGGIFARARANRAKKKAVRTINRSRRKADRFNDKMSMKAQRHAAQRSRRQASAASYIPSPSDDGGYAEEVFEETNPMQMDLATSGYPEYSDENSGPDMGLDQFDFDGGNQ